MSTDSRELSSPHHPAKPTMKLARTAGLAALLAVGVAAPAMADTTTSTFEAPAFKTGSINGQRGWMATGPYDYGVIKNSGAAAGFGQQSFQISSQKTSGSFSDWAFSQEAANEAGDASNHQRFTAEFSFFALGNQVDGSQISVSPDRGDGARMSYARLEDQKDGVHVVFSEVTGGQTPDFVAQDIATLDRTRPHTVKFDMQLIPGASNDVVKVYVDDKLAVTGTSWEDYFRYEEKNPVPNVNRLLFRAGGTATTFVSKDRGFLIDNVTVGTPDDQGPAGPAGATGTPGATGATGASGTVAAARAERRLVGATRRVVKVKRRDGERLVSVRATLKGKSLTVHGRKVAVDLRARQEGTYTVHIAAKYVRADGKLHIVRTTRQLRVSAA